MSREFLRLERKENYRKQQARYFVAYEGEKTEKKYFSDLVNSRLFNNSGKIEFIPLSHRQTGNHPNSIVEALITHKKNCKIDSKKKDEFWAIFDRDDWESEHNVSFDNLIDKCKSEENMFLAISNPCIEIWFVLHFNSIDSLSEKVKNNLIMNEKINKEKNYIDEYLGELLSTRCSDGRTRGYNKAIPFSLIKDSTYDAIDRAKELGALNEDYPKSLGTHVYRLVEKLIISQDEYFSS